MVANKREFNVVYHVQILEQNSKWFYEIKSLFGEKSEARFSLNKLLKIEFSTNFNGYAKCLNERSKMVL